MDHWHNQISEITARFQKHFGNLDTGALNWKPNPDTWSIAQNIDHLILINQSYFPIISKLKSGTYKLPFTARFGFIVSFLGKTVLNSVQPDRKKKIKTFSIWAPSESNLPADILDQFVQHQQLLKKQISASAQLLDKGAILSSPANKYIVYKLETAFDIIVAHEQRHFEQAKEVLSLMKI